MPYNKMKRAFESQFQIDIKIPEEDYINKKSGDIKQDRWVIKYTFYMLQEKMFLEYYAINPFCGDTRARIDENGNVQFISDVIKDSTQPQNEKDRIKMELKKLNLWP